MTARYALYFAPRRDTALWQFGSRCLGRDAETGEILTPPIPDLPPAWTADPRHYGFHATLKPPMTLAKGSTEADLLTSAAAFARTHRRFTAPPLRLTELGRFIALTPSAPSPALDGFAADVVRHFDPFRAPPSPSDLARRRTSGLSVRQDEYLQRWGYPYVFEEFQFHMTLTGSLTDADRAEAWRLLSPLVAPFEASPLEVDGLAVFKQDTRDAAFRITARFALSG